MMLAGFSLFNYSSVFVYAAQGDTHRISYNLDSGTLGEGKWDTYTEGEEFTLPLPKKEGCAFLGWYENPEQSGEPVTTISAEDTGTKNFGQNGLKIFSTMILKTDQSRAGWQDPVR